MCGICGLWSFHAPLNMNHLTEMTQRLAHRGPDEQGVHQQGSVGLGFRRLSIIDVAGSHQPMPNEDERVWLVFNGEIYNFQALRQSLLPRHTFRTQGDTETILHSFEEQGEACVQELRGMFAWAIWDDRQQKLTLAVDRFGKKPLYYWHTPDHFAFASELKSLLCLPDFPRDLDLEALDEYLAYGYISAPRTIFKAIQKIPPAHTLVLELGGTPQLKHYWQPTFAAPDQYDPRPLPELAADLRDLLREATRLRMISEVPLGAFLSGGVDSSAVVGWMSQLSSQPVKTFAIGFEESQFDETHYAQEVADAFHTDHTRFVVRAGDMLGVLPALVAHLDEPFADDSIIPTHYVSQLTRQHVTVALSGDGGDEIFGGYLNYRYAARHALLKGWLPKPLHAPLARYGAPIPKLGNYLKRLNQPIHWWVSHAPYHELEDRRQLYQPDFKGTFSAEHSRLDRLQATAQLPWLSQLQDVDVRIYMAYNILVKVDRMSMFNALEVRSPLLDHHVFEFMSKIPPRYKLAWDNRGRLQTKILLKEAANFLPPNIQKRPKQGFSIPLEHWMSHELQRLLKEVLLNPQALVNQWLNPHTLAQLVAQSFPTCSYHLSRKLWALLILELWLQAHLGDK